MADEFNRDEPGYGSNRDPNYREPGYSNTDADRDTGTGWGIAGLLLLVVLIALAFWGYGWGSRRDTANSGASSGTGGAAVASKDDLSDMSGKAMTASGAIKDVKGAHAFTMSTDDGKQILVVSRQAVNELPINVSAGQEQKVQVQGKVQKFDKDQMQREFGMKADDQSFRDYEGKNILVADSISQAGAGPSQQTPPAVPNEAR